MLTDVVVVAPAGAAWPDFSMPVLRSGNPYGLFLTKVDGLNPVQSAVNTKKSAVVDGEYYTGSSVGKRNIVLNIGIESRYDPEVARDQLYSFFLTKSPIKLRLVFDHRDPVEIEGYYETHDGDRFVQDLEMQISVICPNPNFVDPDLVTVAGLTGTQWYDVDGNPAGGVDQPPVNLLNSGKQSIGMLVRISPDPGDIFIGEVIFEVVTEGATPGTYFTERRMHITPNWLPDPEELLLNSNSGQKAIQIWNPVTDDRRNGMMGMTDDSAWPVLHPGPNLFRVRTVGTETQRAWTAFYYNQYGGV